MKTAKETIDDKKKRAKRILAALVKDRPEDPKTALDYRTPLELLVATILSAQCTDERVNTVTPGLFRKYPDAVAFASASQPELEDDIHSTGFFRNKATSIIGCCQMIVGDFGGNVPDNMDDLVGLPGVGRKTANLILSIIHGIPGIVVDTHVTRVSNRLGLTANKDAAKIEHDLYELLPKKNWISFSNRLVLHGRYVCKAKKPDCPGCVLQKLCPSAFAV
jgi:endonuclease-3